MIWKKVTDLLSYTNRENLLIVYGTNKLVDFLPICDLITSDEIAYSEGLRGEGQKNTWLSCRAALRLALGFYLSKKPIEIELRKSRFGKLFTADADIFFNVSHSKHAFLLGFNPGGRIGIDIELMNGSEDLPSLVTYAFSTAEANYYRNGEGAKRFAEIWTLKEAFLKAVGVGLVNDLTSITVTGESQNYIARYHLKQKSFLCPNGETGSVVYRNNKPLEFIEM
ncbi:MAG: 4'-phosphopantetheinyl transferase superfamily protein [Bacteroidota bacterium]